MRKNLLPWRKNLGDGSAPFLLEYQQKRCFTSERDEARFARLMAVNLAGVVTAMRAVAQVVGEGSLTPRLPSTGLQA